MYKYGFLLAHLGNSRYDEHIENENKQSFQQGFKKLHRRNKMLRTRRTPKDRAAFPTELPSGLRIPAGVSPETYASHRDVLSVLLLRFMTSRLRAMYQAYDGDLTLCLVLGEIASRNTERFYDERRGYQPASFNGQRQYLPCNALSISDVTGIPRETVRRKLAKLVDLGWIEKTPDDMYVITDRIGTVFAAFDDSQTYDLMRTSDQIKNVLQS